MSVPGPLGRAQGGLSADAVEDTIAAVFRQHAYDRTVITTLWDRFWDAVGRAWDALVSAARHAPTAVRIVEWTLAILALVIVARALAIGTFGDRAAGRVVPGRGPRGGRGDPWTDAQRLAAAGRYTDAAHALYAALLDGLASREQVRLHPSKTLGDYARDLRARSSSVLTPFRDFARTYEIVVYGLRPCDRERYERLQAIAARIVAPRP